MRLTISTNTQSTANYLAAADDIMNVFDNFGFTTDNPCVDAAELRTLIANCIRNQIEGNVNYVEAVEPDDNDIALEELLESLREDPQELDVDVPVECQCEFCRDGRDALIRIKARESAERFQKAFCDKVQKKCGCGCDDRREPGE